MVAKFEARGCQKNLGCWEPGGRLHKPRFCARRSRPRARPRRVPVILTFRSSRARPPDQLQRAISRIRCPDFIGQRQMTTACDT